MAESASAPAASGRVVYKGRTRSMVSALALLIAGGLTFVMGMNTVFFVEAMAWTFLVWGALLMYGHLIDFGTEYIATDEALILYSPLRVWGVQRVWPWQYINRLDVVVERVEAREEDLELQIYYTPEDSTRRFREDIRFIPALAQEIVERTGLKPARNQAMQSFDQIPQDEKATYRWE